MLGRTVDVRLGGWLRSPSPKQMVHRNKLNFLQFELNAQMDLHNDNWMKRVFLRAVIHISLAILLFRTIAVNLNQSIVATAESVYVIRNSLSQFCGTIRISLPAYIALLACIFLAGRHGPVKLTQLAHTAHNQAVVIATSSSILIRINLRQFYSIGNLVSRRRHRRSRLLFIVDSIGNFHFVYLPDGSIYWWKKEIQIFHWSSSEAAAAEFS